MISPVDRLREVLVDRYAIERELGSGGMATVYLATDIQNRRKVAIKVLKPDLSDRSGRDRFRREIDIVANLAHPHILPLHDSGSVDDLWWFVSPWIAGESLHDRLSREGPLPLADALRIAAEIADALAYAHDRGLVHRDIKPRNIMMEAGHAVIADFGVALRTDDSQLDRLTSPGVSPGTPHYMSPEQLVGERMIDGRSDIYSLGCVLYEMLAGEPPFTGARVEVIRARKLAGVVPDLRTARPSVPEPVERITLRCLAVSAADRFRNATELVNALRGAAEDLVRAGTTTGGLSDRYPAGRARVRRYVLRAVAGVVVGVAFATLIGALSTRAFDMKLQVPSAFVPSRGDFTATGLKALVPVLFYAFAALIGFILIRQAARLTGAAVHRLMPGVTSRVRSAGDTITPRWHEFWRSAPARTAADGFLVVSILLSGLVIWRYFPLLSTLFTSETAILSCTHRPLHRSFAASMTVLVLALSFGWYGVFRWVDRSKADASGVAIARWGSASLIVLLLLVMNLPWRLFWDPQTERVRVGAERGYIITETAAGLVVYLPSRGASVTQTATAGIERLHINGYVFEEQSAFDSNRARCLSITDPE